MKVIIYNAKVSSWGKPFDVEDLDRFKKANNQPDLELYKVAPIDKNIYNSRQNCLPTETNAENEQDNLRNPTVKGD